MIKYNTQNEHGKLSFTIKSGPFTGVKYMYQSLTEEDGLKYSILENKKLINKNNQLLFETTISSILNDKLHKIEG